LPVSSTRESTLESVFSVSAMAESCEDKLELVD
jgi:hypothetical protein